MKKRQLTVEEYVNPSGSHTITVNNARYQEHFSQKIHQMLKAFSDDGELFFGFYRTDGLNLTAERQKELEKEIPKLFREDGGIKKLNDYVAVARIEESDRIPDRLISIFDYFLETVLFYASGRWEDFRLFYADYQKHSAEELLFNGFAKVLFYYSDSGDFSVCFHPESYHADDVRRLIEEIFYKNKRS